MSNVEYMSARIPQNLKREFKALAAKKGIHLQALLVSILEDYVNRETEGVPKRVDVVAKLKSQQSKLLRHGVEHLYLFGSVARDEAHPDSDIDVVADFGKTVPSLILLGIIQEQLALALGASHKVQFCPLKQMRARVRKQAERDWVKIF